MTRPVVRAVLHRERAGVTVVRVGRDAIAYMTGRPPYHLNPFPSLVVLDLDVADGFRILSWLSESKLLRVAPVIVLSACREPTVEARALAPGALRYLPKPLDPTALMHEVAAVLRPGSATFRNTAGA